MNVLIDRERMVFLYAHESREALNNIMWIECRDAATIICSCDTPADFEGFTDLELKFLYKHTTTYDHNGLSRAQLLQVLCDLAQRLAPLNCNPLELHAAANCIKPDDGEPYRYIKGSAKPAPQPDIYTPPGLKVPRSEQEEQAARTALRAAKAATWPWGENRAPLNSNPAPKAARAPSAVTAPKGGVRETIWAVANRIWEEAGKPMNKDTVLVLRKRMMDELEQQGVKRTSSSNELGNWQKFHLK